MFRNATGRLALVLFILLCAPAPFHAASSNSFKLALIGEPKLVVEPACSSCDSGTLDVSFRNENPGTVPLFISADQNLTDAAGNPTAARVSRALINPKTRKEYDESKENSLERDAVVIVRLTVTNIREEGEWKAKIYNHGAEIATISVYRFHSPFNVKLDVPKPDQPELTFDLGTFNDAKSLKVPLQNDDNYSYRLRLEFWALGIPACATVILPPKSSVVAAAKFSNDKPTWFNNRTEGRFRDVTAEGQLVLRQSPEETCPGVNCSREESKDGSAPASTPAVSGGCGSQAPCPAASPACNGASKIIPVTIHLRYYTQPIRYLFIGFVLLFGALCSLLLNAYLPNQVKRSKLKKQLKSLAARIRSLPIELASRVRVSLGLEERQCKDLLLQDLAINPRFSEVLDEINPRVDMLTKRLELAERLGALRLRFQALSEHHLFPTPMDAVQKDFEQADDLLRQWTFDQPTETVAEQLIKGLGTQMDNLEDVKKFYTNQHDVVDQIISRTRYLLLDGPDTPPGTDSHWPEHDPHSKERMVYRRMYFRLLDFWRKVQPQTSPDVPQTPPSPPLEHGEKPKPSELKAINTAKELFPQEDLLDADRLTTKMTMLRECARLQDKPEYLTELALLLESQNLEEFNAARRLLGQVKERVHSSQAEAGIRNQARRKNIREWRDWGAYPILKRLDAVCVTLFWILVTISAVLLSLHKPHIAYAGLFLLIALAALLAAVGDPVTQYGLLEDRCLEKEDPNRTKKRFATIWVAREDKVFIELGTNEVRVFEPVQLRVKFSDESLNFEDVLGDFTPVWNFDHDNLTHEEGWAVTHYFPRERTYNVRVKFQRRKGGFLEPSDHAVQHHDAHPHLPDPADLSVYVLREIKATPTKRPSVMWALVGDGIWVIVALIPALAALFTGAIDQLNKLDFMTAMIAIFGLGFASDQLKNFIKSSQ